jgi:hypothetical protein
VSLSGNLGFVPIEEVLRLLTRSRQQGAVEVTGDGLRGRVFVGKGGIDLATTWVDEDLHRHLVNSGFAEDSSLRRITTAETTLAAIAESNEPIIDLLREMTVESIYQIGHRGEEFEVHEGLTTPYASPRSFDLESLLEDAAERERDWAKVNEIVPDRAVSIGFRRDLGEREEVTVKVDDWKVLSEIGIGSSVSDIADRLGTTEFWTARVAARLVKNDLVVIADDWGGTASRAEAVTDRDTADVFSEPTAEHTADDDETYDDSSYLEDDQELHQPPVEAEQSFGGADEVDPGDEMEEAAHGESWWQEPEPEVGEPEVSETPVEEDDSKIADTDDDDPRVEEDTEAFLEKVFSELESSDEEPEEQQEPEDEGHGLLRRRRMGTLRDFSSDS